MISISFKSTIHILAITALFVTTAMTMHAQVSLPAAGNISTVAGNGTAGYSGDNGLATAANLSVPEAVAVDSAGNIYIADTFNCVIRRVAASTGYISTVAGNGTRGYSGDGGTATIAELYMPTGVAVDTAGNIYFADNQRIRKVTASTGIITTVAGSGIQGYSGDGGPATRAELNWPWAVAVDAAGNIYFTDTDNQRIRKVAVSTGIITTVAGTGTAGYSGDGGPATSANLNSPFGIAVDAAGNIYIADYFNNRVRKVTASTGDISTVAGNGTQGFSGDGATATSAEMYYPTSVAVDTVGNLYIADDVNDRIRKVTASTGIIQTLAGTGSTGYSGDGGLATGGELFWPYGVALDTAGNIYIADKDNNRIRAVGSGRAPTPGPGSSISVTVTSSDPTPTMGESVTLTATVLNSLSSPATSGTVSWLNGSTSIGQSNVDSNGIATILTTLGPGGNQLITANYTGTSQMTGTLALHVAGFSFTASTPTVKVTSGQSLLIAVNGSSYYGFSGPVDLTCSGMPSPGSCALSASTVNFNNGTTSQSLTLTVRTATVAAPQVAQVTSPLLRGLALATLFPLFGLVGIRSKRVRGALVVLLLTVGAIFTLGLSGCGGAPGSTTTSSPTSPTTSDVAPGTYTVTVVAQSGVNTVQVPVTVTVQ
jgi:sugar lactone lactonase YvrE